MMPRHIKTGNIVALIFLIIISVPYKANAACSFTGNKTTATGTIAFGDIDPSGTATVPGTITSPVFTCGNGDSYTITLSPASPESILSGTNTLGYNLSVVASGKATGNNSITVFTAATITSQQYADAAAGTYNTSSSTPTVTISWTKPSSGSITATLPSGNVTATITAACQYMTGGTLAFGTIDPSGSSSVSATGASLAYACTSGKTFNITGISGANGETAVTCSASPCTFTGVMKSTGTTTDTLGYTLSITSMGPYTGTGLSSAVSVPFTGTISVTQFQDAVPHTDYAETVTITITY